MCIIGVLGILCVISSGDAFARGWPQSQHSSRHVVMLPPRHEVVAVRGRRFHYHDGRFYRQGFFGFDVVLPPLGAVVAVLPSGHRTVIVRGVTYYDYDDVYYLSSPSGYMVVADPTVYNYAAPISSALPSAAVSGETVIVNVPNSNGSYTAVTLVKTQSGYVGPQGEFYPTHPTIVQLKALYGH